MAIDIDRVGSLSTLDVTVGYRKRRSSEYRICGRVVRVIEIAGVYTDLLADLCEVVPEDTVGNNGVTVIGGVDTSTGTCGSRVIFKSSEVAGYPVSGYGRVRDIRLRVPVDR